MSKPSHRNSDHDAASTVFSVIDLLPAAPSDQLTATVSVLMFETDVSMVKLRVKDTPPEVTDALPETQLFDPPAGTAPALA
jgi:hypothetical protein